MKNTEIMAAMPAAALLRTSAENVQDVLAAITTLAAPTVQDPVQTAAEWVSVGEGLPHDGETVLIHCPDPVEGPGIWDAQWSAGSCTFESGLHGWVAFDEVSHWLRIPPVPGQQVAQGEKGGDGNG